MKRKRQRIAAYGGFRTIPPRAGGAGSDKFAFELYPRIVKRGYDLIAYCRIYPKEEHYTRERSFKGVKLAYIKTVQKAGFDTLVHSCKATIDVIFNNTADIVHLHSGANSIWAFFLRLAGKKVYVSQFAMDWKRDKWPWYAKLFYLFSNYCTAYLPNDVIFDNIYTKKYFENKFKKTYCFIPYGSDAEEPKDTTAILEELGLLEKEYFLFVGRFIPDKGVHLLIDAFQKTLTSKKLVLIGGAPNPSDYETKIKRVSDSRISFPGYMYGDDTNILIKKAYAYIQPSLIEGLSPVILTVMGLGTPLLCSDIAENTYITKENATHFMSGKVESLQEKIGWVLKNRNIIEEKARLGKIDVASRFNWEKITDKFIDILINNNMVDND